MNEQERAARFTSEVDRLLEPGAPPTLRETPISQEGQELLELAQTLAQIDLSPQSAFLRRLRQPQGDKMQTPILPSIFQLRRLVFISGVIALVLAVALLTVPATRVMANELWQSLFVRHSSDSQSFAEPFEVSAVATATPIPVEEHQPALSLAEATALAGFDVKEVASVPEGFTLANIHYNAEQKAVTLLYLNRQWLGITLRQEPAAMATPWIIGETAVVETVTIGDNSGEYVRGEWVMAGTQPDESRFLVQGSVWIAAGPAQHLRWVDGDMVYTLATSPARESGLVLADLLHMAESLR
jgi:hypothetical protein